MQIGMVGLGRMGANMVRRLRDGEHACVVFDLDAKAVEAVREEGAEGASSLDDFVRRLEKPRTAWVMVPSGKPTEETVSALGGLMEAGDAIVDGGNGFFKDDIRRAAALAGRGIHYLDAGVSGGVWGRERGYCLMVGGPGEAFERLRPVFRTLAPGHASAPRTPGREDTRSDAEEGFVHCGPAGSGHFVKMVHNGIEYGVMQAFAEGFELMRAAGSLRFDEGTHLDLKLDDIAEVWRRGSVISSWLLDLTAQALYEDPALEDYAGFVQDSGEGRWTVQTAVEAAVPAHVLSAALYARFRSRQEQPFADKLLSAMREKFGGHVEPRRRRP